MTKITQYNFLAFEVCAAASQTSAYVLHNISLQLSFFVKM